MPLKRKKGKTNKTIKPIADLSLIETPTDITRIGRPLKFKTPEMLEEGIQQYLDYCMKNDEPLTITGMCIFLGTTRETIKDYRLKPEYSDILKKAKDRVAYYVERGLLKGKINPIAAIFHLTNLDPDNWRQKQEVQHSGSIALGVIQLPSKEIGLN